MAGIFRAGQFELQEAKLVSSSGDVIDISLSVQTITIFEDITQLAMSGSMLIQDAINLASLFPIIGQEYLLLKLATASTSGSDVIIDYSKNGLFVNNISSRIDIGNGVQGYQINFVSREFIVDQRVKVNKSMTGSSSNMVKDIFISHLGTKKTLNIEPSDDNRKIIVPNKRPFDIIRDIMNQTRSVKHGDPCYLCYETTKGFNFRSLASMYAQPSRIEYKQFIDGTRTNKGAVNLEADFSTLLSHNIVATNDTIYAGRVGTYGSILYTHDIISKSYQKHTYNYIDNFEKETHIESTHSKYRGENLIDYPIVSSSTITADRKRISDFPSRTFVLPTAGRGSSNTVTDEFNQFVYSSNSPEFWVQRRMSQIQQLEKSFTVHVEVHGNTAISAGDIVDINIPYTATAKTSKKEKYDNIYKGKFLVSKLRHDFSILGKYHKMNIEAIKDSLTVELPSFDSPEFLDDGEQMINEDLY